METMTMKAEGVNDTHKLVVGERALPVVAVYRGATAIVIVVQVLGGFDAEVRNRGETVRVTVG